jgi:hypothetical protein
MRIFAVLSENWDVHTIMPDERLALVPIPENPAESCWRTLCFTALNEVIRTAPSWLRDKDRWPTIEGGDKTTSPLIKYHQRDRKELSWSNVAARYKAWFDCGGVLKPSSTSLEGDLNTAQMKEHKLEPLLVNEVENEHWGDCTKQIGLIRNELADAIFDDVVKEFVVELTEEC